MAGEHARDPHPSQRARRWPASATVRAGRCAAALGCAAALASCGDGATIPTPERLTFAPPVAGTPMVDVFYGAYMDHDSGDRAIDYACGIKAYPGHRGVDILLRNFREQDAGFHVLAAAGGTVAAVVDGFPDRNTDWGAGGGFGNHVVVDHADDIRSIYAHLRRESVLVAPGQRVQTGTPLGLVGSSGRSSWPHLHFEVQREGVALDPFTGPCAPGEGRWFQQLDYQDAFLVTDAGILDGTAEPDIALLLERPATVRRFPLDAERFAFWVQIANQPAAAVRIEVRDPEGTPVFAIHGQVPATFSMRYLATLIPIAGVLTTPGSWEVQVYQEGERIWSEPFGLDPPSSGAAPAQPRGPPPPATGAAIRVLEPTPGHR